MGPWNSSSAVGHRLCSLPGLWRFPVAEASFQHQRQSHKSDFPWNHVKRTGAVTGYVYSLQRPFQPKLLRDITSGFKQNDLCQLFFRRSTWKAKIILKEHCLPEVLTLWDLISTLSLFWTAQSRYNLIHMTMQISRLPMNTEIYLTVSQSEDLFVWSWLASPRVMKILSSSKAACLVGFSKKVWPLIHHYKALLQGTFLGTP